MAACGVLHTAIVTEGGDLWACGTGGSGRLGLGAEDNVFLPRRVGGKELFGASVIMAACGEEHSAIVVHGGAVWTSGKGECGRLGTGDEVLVLLYIHAHFVCTCERRRERGERGRE